MNEEEMKARLEYLEMLIYPYANEIRSIKLALKRFDEHYIEEIRKLKLDRHVANVNQVILEQYKEGASK
tara:strand:- start:1011 stop:1217 length:207 start_codon:yes stop_codon:yes gene_type:complete